MPTKGKDIEEIKKWETRIASGKEYMKSFGMPNSWQPYRNYYRGIFDRGTPSERKYSVALIFSIIRSMVPQIYYKNPSIVVTNEIPGYYLASKIVQKIDNKIIRDIKLKNTMKEAIRDACLCGTVPILSGYDSAYGYDRSHREKVQNPETGEEQEIGGTLLQFDTKSGNKIEFNERIKPGKPWSDTIKPEFVIVPYACDRMWKLPWIARLYIRELEDVKLDRRLSLPKDFKGNAMSNFDWFKEKQLHQKLSENEKADYVFIWEVRDFRTGEILLFTEGHDKFLYKEKDVLQKFGNPYNELTFNYNPGIFWGLPDARYLEDQQLAINETRTLHLEHRRISKLRFIYDENIIDEGEVLKLLTEETGVAIKASGDVEKAVKIFQPYVPPDFNIDVDAIRKDAREISGLSRNQVGEFEGGRRTATESQIVSMASQIRISERKEMVADLFVDIVQKYNKYIFSEWNVQQVVDIVGSDGKRYWVQFSYKDIDSNYAFRVDPESSQPISSEQKKEEALAVAQYIHNSPVLAASAAEGKPLPYNLEALDRYVLSQFDTVPLDEIMPPTSGAGMNPEQPIPIQELQKKFMANQNNEGGGEVANI